jgi:hypothetical protein
MAAAEKRNGTGLAIRGGGSIFTGDGALP